MKVFAFTFLIAIFLANTVIVSAWAKSCLNVNPSSTSQMSDDMNHDMGKTPCEDMQQNQNQNDTQHCDGVCFCMHMSSSQTPTIGESSIFQTPFSLKLSHDFINEAIASLSYSPDKRPPKV